MKRGKLRHSNSTWSLTSWSTPLNKRKRKSSPESPPPIPRRASLAEMLCDINKVDSKGRSLLFYAAQCDQPEVAIQLLMAGCDPNIADFHGNAPLHEAAENGHLEVARLLIQDGRCSLDPINALGQTPLMRAVANDNINICKMLVKAGCNKNLTDHMNRSALLIGLQEGSEQTALFLLKSGCDVNTVDREGHSAFYYAINSTHIKSLTLAKKILHSGYLLGKDALWLLGSDNINNDSLLQTDKKFQKTVLSKAGLRKTEGVLTRNRTISFLSRLQQVFRTSKSTLSSPSSSIRSSRTSSVCSDDSE